MSPRRLRLLLRDLAAGAAFGTMAVSGQVPAWAMGLFLVALALAVADLRAFARATTASAVAVLAASGGLALLVVGGRLDPVVAACSLAGLVCAQRLLSAPAPAVDGQVHLLGLLMVSGGAALTGELPYASLLLLFAVLASVSLGLGTLEAAVPEGEPVPTRAGLTPLAAGVVWTLVGAVAFFAVFPRVNWRMASRRSAASFGTPTAGFSDGVRFGGSGTIKRSARVVARLTLEPDPGRDELGGHFFGRAYDTFDGVEWTSQGRPGAAQPMVTLRPGGAGLTHQWVELLPGYGARTLIALEQPSRVGNALAHTPAGTQRTLVRRHGAGEVRFVEDAPGYTYAAYSASSPDVEAAARLSPTERDQLLALPEGLDPRVLALAQSVAPEERDPLRVARALEAHLQRGYAYTLELAGEVPDPLAHFLFERRAGHCEHFASALTLLLRARGVPARLVTGFYGGERVGEHYVLRAGDAHAWTQALVPGQGWVSLDATPPAGRVNQATPWLEQLALAYELLESRWRALVVDYSFRDQVDLVRKLLPDPRPPEAAPGRGVRLPSPRALGAALLAALAGFGLVRQWTRRRARARPHAASQLLEALERALARAGVARRPGEQLEELTHRLAAQRHPLASTLEPATRRYLEARFGERPLAPGEARALVRALEQAADAGRAARAG